jgi:hypothetical protein
MCRRVPRRVHDADVESPDRQPITITDTVRLEEQLVVGVEHVRGAGAARELVATGHVVVVDVRLDDIQDIEP